MPNRRRGGSISGATVSCIIAAWADPKARDRGGLTPLHAAAILGTPETVVALLDAGADPKARTGDGRTPLHWAVAIGTPDTVAALLDAGADPKARAKDGSLPADLAEDNAAVRDHSIFWTLNRARFD
ncbi:MAG: ankyrin repeat domain-containing protein [Rhodobacteraceae bacterium]|nr:ankyrin repeat domain-containing protein [Paracoccaceae bacterium]